MKYILPSGQLAQLLQVRTQQYCQALMQQTRLPIMPFTQQQCCEIIVAMFDDAVGQQLRWSNESHGRMHQTIHSFWPWWDDMGEEPISDSFYTQVLDELEIEVQEWVQRLIPDSTWLVWYVRALGPDIILEKGEDFRVLDWHRRMATGDWRHGS